MSLYITGDTHGDADVRKLYKRKFPQRVLDKNDYVLICGDCGAVWDGAGFDRYIQRYWKNKNWTTLYVDGNHENFDILNSLPVEEWCGGKIHRVSESVIHLMRGQVFDIDGHKIFTMGGASSHDKIYRKEGVSWWKAELPSEEEYNEALKNLEKHNNTVDYVVTHCASSEVQDLIPAGSYEKDELTGFLKLIDKDVDFKHWYFGHYHKDLEVDNKHTALYQSVIQLW